MTDTFSGRKTILVPELRMDAEHLAPITSCPAVLHLPLWDRPNAGTC